MRIKCGRCRGDHSTVAEVRECYRPAPVKVITKPAGLGVYRKDGQVYVVRKAKQSGLLYCVKIDGPDETLIKGGRWLLTDSDRMTVEEVAALGVILVRCIVCGAGLKNKKSRDLGIGPICRGYV